MPVLGELAGFADHPTHHRPATRLVTPLVTVVEPTGPGDDA